MKTTHTFSDEEIKVIKDAIAEELDLWNHPFIEANNGEGSGISMSKETFFKNLERKLKGK